MNNWGIVFQPPTMRNKTNGSIRTPRDSVRSFQVLTGKGPGSRGVLLHQVSLTSVENMRVICQSIPIAAHDDLWGPLLGFTCITSGRLFVRFHAEGPPREPPVVDSEATSNVRPGEESIWTIKRLLRVWSQPPVGHLDDFVATSITGGMRRETNTRRPEGPGSKLLGSALDAPC